MEKNLKTYRQNIIDNNYKFKKEYIVDQFKKNILDKI